MMFFVLALLALLLLGAIAVVVVSGRLLLIGAPDELLLLAGARRRDGEREVGYRYLRGGRALRLPLLEQGEVLNVTNITVTVDAAARLRMGEPVTLSLTANLRPAAEAPAVHDAIECLCGKSRSEVAAIARALLQGAAAAVVAQLEPEQLLAGEELGERIAAEARDDLLAIGITLDTLAVKGAADNAGYLDAVRAGMAR